MLFIRRSLAGLLALLLVPVLLVTLVAFRINATFTGPDFYVEELRRADVYTFLYDDLLPQAVDEFTSNMGELPLGMELTNEQIVAAVRQIAPQDWTQLQMEQVIGELVPYATGEEEEFRIVVPLQERGQTALAVLTELVLGQVDGIHSHIFEELLPMSIDQRLQGQGDLPLGLELTGGEIGEALKEVAPPEWARRQVRGIIDEVGPYVIGQSEGFQVSIPLTERAESALQVVKRLGQGQATRIHANIFDELIPRAVDERLSQQGQLPFGLDLKGAEIGAAFKEVAPADWVRLQMGLVIDGVGPYLIGQQDGFAVTIPLAERAEVALKVITELLSEADLQDFLFQELIAPAVESNFGGSVNLAAGVTVTRQEILDAMSRVITDEWLSQQLQVILTSAGPYLIGQQDGFRASVSLALPKEAAAGAIADLAERKLVELVQTYPPCALVEVPQQVLAILAGRLPTCLPPRIPIAEILALVDTEALVGVAIRGQLPDDIVFTEADLRGALDEGSLALLDRTREILSQGWTFTDADLRKRLSPNSSDLLDRVREVSSAGWTFTDADLRQRLSPSSGLLLDRTREIISQGWTFTDADLRQMLSGAGPQDTVELVEAEGQRMTPELLEAERQRMAQGATFDLDRFRNTARQARQGRYLSILLIGVLVGGVGFLGGRSWPGRLGWAAAALATTALVIYIAGGPAAAGRFDASLEDLRVQAQQGKEGVTLLATAKALEVVEHMARDFRAAVTSTALTLFLVGAVLSGGASAWHLLARRRG